MTMTGGRGGRAMAAGTTGGLGGADTVAADGLTAAWVAGGAVVAGALGTTGGAGVLSMGGAGAEAGWDLAGMAGPIFSFSSSGL